MSRRIVRIYGPVYAGTVGSSHGDLNGAFSRLPKYPSLETRSALLTLGTFLAFLTPFLVMVAMRPDLRHGMWAIFTFAGMLISAIWGTSRVVAGQRFRNQMQMQTLDEATIGKARDGEWYVGVSYCHGAWNYRGDIAWDRGFLSVREGVLHYRSFGPDFELPLDRIDSVAICEFAANRRPYVRIHWVTEEGKLNCLNLFVRSALSFEDLLRRTEDLAAWIGKAEPDASADHSTRPLPFESSKVGFGHSPSQAIRLDDILASLGAAVALGAAIAAIGSALDSVTGHFSFMWWIVAQFSSWMYAVVMQKRIKARGDIELAAQRAGAKPSTLKIESGLIVARVSQGGASGTGKTPYLQTTRP